MTDNNKTNQNNEQVSDEQLQDVSGGNKIHKTRLEALDTRDSSKSIDNIQKARLDALDTRDSSK